jgi:hypothetical protein
MSADAAAHLPETMSSARVLMPHPMPSQCHRKTIICWPNCLQDVFYPRVLPGTAPPPETSLPVTEPHTDSTPDRVVLHTCGVPP